MPELYCCPCNAEGIKCNCKTREIEQKIKDAYIAGYETGHDDTVESSYGSSEELAEDYLKDLNNNR